MSFWTRETTADIGLRVFSNNLSNLFKETAIGMQSLIISKQENLLLNQKIRHTSQSVSYTHLTLPTKVSV